MLKSISQSWATRKYVVYTQRHTVTALGGEDNTSGKHIQELAENAEPLVT